MSAVDAAARTPPQVRSRSPPARSARAESDPAAGPAAAGHGIAFQRRGGTVLGSGGTATVRAGSDAAAGNAPVAVKVARASLGEHGVAALETEAGVLGQLDHPSVVSLVRPGVMQRRGCHYLALELADGGSMRARAGRLDEPAVRSCARQVASALAYCHARGYAHLDVKAANVLDFGGGRVKLADFGSACALRPDGFAAGGFGTPLWMAPEVIAAQRFDGRADVWGLGCLVIELASGAPPWAGQIPPHLSGPAVVRFLQSSRATPRVPGWLSSEAADFCAQCLARDPAARPPAAQVLGHAWLEEL